MKLTFVSLCAIVLIKLHEGSILNKIRYFRSPHYPNSKLSIFRIPVNYTKPVNNNENVLNIQWLYQRLDNFNASDTRQWKMRYLFNEQYFEKDGPIFIVVGGQQEISTTPLSSGYLPDLAKKYKAIIFHTEHRYYGQSQPTQDLSTTNLKYLTSRQALADLAHFVETLKKNLRFKNSKVILYGASYSGSLVVWFRRLYPRLIDGGWASSAQILANMEVKDFTYRIASAIAKRTNYSCFNRIKNGFSELKKLYMTSRLDEAKSRLRLCDSFNGSSSLDISSLFLSIINAALHSVVEHTISDICETAFKNGEDDLTTVTKLLWSKYNSEDCGHFSYNETFLKIINTTNLRQTFYQRCNEFGGFVSPQGSEPFGEMVKLDLYVNMCQQAFGQKYDIFYIQQSIEKTNSLYGGLYPGVTNIYFTQAEFNPWRFLGEVEALVIPDVIDDTLAILPNESPKLKASKDKIDQLIGDWIIKKD